MADIFKAEQILLFNVFKTIDFQVVRNTQLLELFGKTTLLFESGICLSCVLKLLNFLEVQFKTCFRMGILRHMSKYLTETTVSYKTNNLLKEYNDLADYGFVHFIQLLY